MPSKYAKVQIRMLELLKEHNLLDMAVEGKLPTHVLKAAKVAAISETAGIQKSADGATAICTPEEHEEAERELDEFLKHYRLDKALRTAAKAYTPRTFRKGAKYGVRSGYFEGRTVVYKGTDQEVFGCGWMDNPGHPSCERFLFRAQRDRLSVSLPTMVFSLPAENRDILLQEREIGMEVA